MSEFNNRIAAQREILMIVNQSDWAEQLFGLSSGAIDRWVAANRLGASSELAELLRRAAEKLFFLSNKSQEQIADDYRILSRQVSELTAQIERAMVQLRQSFDSGD